MAANSELKGEDISPSKDGGLLFLLLINSLKFVSFLKVFLKK
jgi:hypothetical protein